MTCHIFLRNTTMDNLSYGNRSLLSDDRGFGKPITTNYGTTSDPLTRRCYAPVIHIGPPSWHALRNPLEGYPSPLQALRDEAHSCRQKPSSKANVRVIRKGWTETIEYQTESTRKTLSKAGTGSQNHARTLKRVWGREAITSHLRSHR